MLAEIFTRYFHFVFIIVMSGALMGEAFLLKAQMSKKELKTLAKLDALYGLSAVLVVAAGLTLWFGVGKSAVFYTQNPVFHLKLSLAILIGLISIYPTVFYLKKSKGTELNEQVQIPPNIQKAVYLQLFLLALIPMLAVLMAKGINIFE